MPATSLAPLIVALVTALHAGAAHAQTAWGSLDDLHTGRVARGPAGWLNWCIADLSRCGAAQRLEPVPATPALMALLERVQRDVNAAITPSPEPTGRDLWRDDARAGDCEDYALAKRAQLRRAGLPAGAVRLATAALPSGELHAVLTVETDHGTLILDNLKDGVVPLRALDYGWRRVEGVEGSLQWRELGVMTAVAMPADTARTAAMRRSHRPQ